MDIYSKLTGYIADDSTPGIPPSVLAPPDLTKDAISLQVNIYFFSSVIYHLFIYFSATGCF